MTPTLKTDDVEVIESQGNLRLPVEGRRIRCVGCDGADDNRDKAYCEAQVFDCQPIRSICTAVVHAVSHARFGPRLGVACPQKAIHAANFVQPSPTWRTLSASRSWF